MYNADRKAVKMKYCKKCKHIYNDSDEKCSVCKKPLFEIVDENTPVYIISAGGFELQRIKTALEDSGIPNDSISQKHNFSAQAVTGYDTAEYDILVPYCAYEKAYDVCVGIGAIKDGTEEIIDDDSSFDSSSEKSIDEQFEKMSGAKRTTVRVVSALLFLLLIALVVFGTDYIMEFIKNLFG